MLLVRYGQYNEDLIIIIIITAVIIRKTREK